MSTWKLWHGNNNDVTWASWRLKSPAAPPFVQYLVQAHIKGVTKTHYYWLLRGICWLLPQRDCYNVLSSATSEVGRRFIERLQQLVITSEITCRCHSWTQLHFKSMKLQINKTQDATSLGHKTVGTNTIWPTVFWRNSGGFVSTNVIKAYCAWRKNNALWSLLIGQACAMSLYILARIIAVLRK